MTGAASGRAIRAAHAADADAVAALEADALGDDAWPHGLVAELVVGAVPTAQALVAERDGVVVGYAATSLVVDVAELQRIAVDPVERRTGVGSALLGDVLGLCRDAGARRLLLEVREDNDGARAFYARAGFVEVGTRPRYYRDGEAAVLLERSTASGPETNEWTTS